MLKNGNGRSLSCRGYQGSDMKGPFGCVEGVISASSEELQVVEGIGKKIADKIRWVVGEKIMP
ncbi:MAG: hypothetical protein JRJ41_13340 [Deltaproteobacteria bacterium]|nr:hypothetical protein [Deltaproteobacteria bacterium]